MVGGSFLLMVFLVLVRFVFAGLILLVSVGLFSSWLRFEVFCLVGLAGFWVLVMSLGPLFGVCRLVGLLVT